MKIISAPTPADLSTPTVVVIGLNQLLASTYALMANTQFAYWNSGGRNLSTLREAYKQHYENLFVAVEALAERIAALGGHARGGLSNLSVRSGFAELTGPMDEHDLATALIAAHRKVTADAILLCDAAIAAHDQESHDLAISRIQWHEKTVWMLRSYSK